MKILLILKFILFQLFCKNPGVLFKFDKNKIMEIEELFNLSPSRRILLAQKLWDSVPKKEVELSNPIKKELDRRLKAHQKGEMKYYTRKELKTKLQGL